MVQLNTTNSKTLNIILANTNKALGEVLKESSPKDLSAFTQTKDLGSLLESLLKNDPQNKTQKQEMLQLLKNNPTLKDLSNTSSSFKNLNQTLQKSLQQSNETLPNLQKLDKLLSQTLNDIANIDDKALKNKLENSGVFLESKLKNFTPPKTELQSLTQQLITSMQNSKIPTAGAIAKDLATLLESELFKANTTDTKTLTQLTQKLDLLLEKTSRQMHSNFDKTQHPQDPLFSQTTKNLHDKITDLNQTHKLYDSQKIKELFSDDLKNVVQKSLQELESSNISNKSELVKQLDKIALQIDYYQLLSHLSDTSAIYLPYSFDALQDGKISIKSAKNNKFFCDIELQLKEYGELKLRLGIFEKNQLNINIECQSDELQAKMQANLQELRENLFNAGIYPQDIRFVNYQQDDTSYLVTDDLALGFEVKA